MTDDLVHCYGCDAVYRPGPDWRLIQHHPGTTGLYDIFGRIRVDHCPICRRPPQLTPALEARPM